MIELSKLSKFLVKAKKSTYASGDSAKEIKENNESTTLIFEEGYRKYHDNYFGGEPYGGREVVFFKGSPVYMMVYYGWVEKDVGNIGDIYKTLQQALSLIPENKPYRGPTEHKNGEYIYSNSFVGEVDNFSGEEKITLNGKEVYKAKYIGGLVDQIKESNI